MRSHALAARSSTRPGAGRARRRRTCGPSSAGLSATPSTTPATTPTSVHSSSGSCGSCGAAHMHWLQGSRSLWQQPRCAPPACNGPSTQRAALAARYPKVSHLREAGAPGVGHLARRGVERACRRVGPAPRRAVVRAAQQQALRIPVTAACRECSDQPGRTGAAQAPERLVGLAPSQPTRTPWERVCAGDAPAPAPQCGQRATGCCHSPLLRIAGGAVRLRARGLACCLRGGRAPAGGTGGTGGGRWPAAAAASAAHAAALRSQQPSLPDAPVWRAAGQEAGFGAAARRSSVCSACSRLVTCCTLSFCAGGLASPPRPQNKCRELPSIWPSGQSQHL